MKMAKDNDFAKFLMGVGFLVVFFGLILVWALCVIFRYAAPEAPHDVVLAASFLVYCVVCGGFGMTMITLGFAAKESPPKA